MASYRAEIDEGKGGSEKIEARNAQEALSLAIVWARDGSWPVTCTVFVKVTNQDNPDDQLEMAVEVEANE